MFSHMFDSFVDPWRECSYRSTMIQYFHFPLLLTHDDDIAIEVNGECSII